MIVNICFLVEQSCFPSFNLICKNMTARRRHHRCDGWSSSSELFLEVDMPRHDSKVVPDNWSILLKAAKYWIRNYRFNGAIEGVWIKKLTGNEKEGEYRRDNHMKESGIEWT